jgi:hypothetical protein
MHLQRHAPCLGARGHTQVFVSIYHFYACSAGTHAGFLHLFLFWFSVFNQFSLYTARGDTRRFMYLFIFSFHQFCVFTARGRGHTQTLAHLNIQVLHQSGGGHGGLKKKTKKKMKKKEQTLAQLNLKCCATKKLTDDMVSNE